MLRSLNLLFLITIKIRVHYYHMKWLAALVLTAGLLLVPVFIQFERSSGPTWTTRLLLPTFEAELARHTPRLSEGTFLPTTIAASRTLKPADNPVLITHPTQVAEGVTLTISPGTHLFFHEFSSLVVAGTLNAVGTPVQPITLQTNELHPLNQVWHGISVTPTGKATLTYLEIEDASPALSCLPTSHLGAEHITITRGSMGIFAASPTCAFADIIMTGIRDAVAAVGVTPPLFTGDSRVSGNRSGVTMYPLP